MDPSQDQQETQQNISKQKVVAVSFPQEFLLQKETSFPVPGSPDSWDWAMLVRELRHHARALLLKFFQLGQKSSEVSLITDNSVQKSGTRNSCCEV